AGTVESPVLEPVAVLAEPPARVRGGIRGDPMLRVARERDLEMVVRARDRPYRIRVELVEVHVGETRLADPRTHREPAAHPLHPHVVLRAPEHARIARS